mmetsp:Transcript_85612/g.184833  ORF Transcript_85612/g.184833 Transcript_85612/m.184833 type:complete len:113 (+) Transcript_85612:1094-1432(+)|eukprot:CAMPEP_0116916066 /NCGR_PEP_ID=MMETSP0467-20121206/18304_1 /TAXON_ID=283647 /ORGANISM="Mesodinium pulex, Strain SPMC105" /LENGTH=112 /DNA_ID=CAMNT_0004592853 /DNA_START=1093 /DNA_END=1431 /DNA_ORIENTATION=+
MKNIVECDCEIDEETDEWVVNEEDKDYSILQKVPNLQMKNGQLRMFDSIGSKVIWINVDHTYEGLAEVSYWYIQQLDFDDEMKKILELKVEDQDKEKQGLEYYKLSNSEIDV